MKPGQLMEYNLRNLRNFSLKIIHKVWCRNYSQTFLKKNKTWAYLRINVLKFYGFCVHCLSNWGLSKLIETKMQTPCFYFIYSYFKKQKGLELVSLSHFLHNFWRKISCYILLPDQISLSGCVYFVRYWVICVL